MLCCVRAIASPVKLSKVAGGKQLMDVGGKLKSGMKDRDNMERAQTIGATVPFFYSVLMASFLSLFVPQKCPGGKTCTLSENVTDLKTYNKIVLAFNCAAALALVLGQVLYVKRENWMIKHLDTDIGEAYDTLADGAFVEQYPHLVAPLFVRHTERARILLCFAAPSLTALRSVAEPHRVACTTPDSAPAVPQRHNRRCTVVSVVTLVVLAMNFVLSAVLVLHMCATPLEETLSQQRCRVMSVVVPA